MQTEILTRSAAHAALVARRRRMAAGAVRDDGIDLRRRAAPVAVAAPPQHDDHVVRYWRHWRPDAGARAVGLVARCVADHLCVAEDVMRSRSQRPDVARARHIAMYVSRETTGRSLPEIARCFGRHHTAVLDACRRMAALEAEGLLPEAGAVRAALAKDA